MRALIRRCSAARCRPSGSVTRLRSRSGGSSAATSVARGSSSGCKGTSTAPSRTCEQRSTKLRRPCRCARRRGRLHDHDEASAHLHELSGADTLVDLVGAFWLLDELRVERVYSSPLPAPRG